MPPKRKNKKTAAVHDKDLEPTSDAEQQAPVAAAAKRKRSSVGEFWKVAGDADDTLPSAKSKAAKTAGKSKPRTKVLAAVNEDESEEDELIAASSTPLQFKNKLVEGSEDELVSEGPPRVIAKKPKPAPVAKKGKAAKQKAPPTAAVPDIPVENVKKKQKVIAAVAASASPDAMVSPPAPKPAKKRPAAKPAGPIPGPVAVPPVQQSRKKAPAEPTSDVTKAAAAVAAAAAGPLSIAQAAEDDDGVASASELDDAEADGVALPAMLPREPLLAGEWVSRAQHEKLRVAIQQLEARYELLKQTGVRDAEASLVEYKRTAEARIEACEAHNTSLQRETKALRSQLATAQKAHTQLETRLVDVQKEVRDARATLAERDAALKASEEAAARAAGAAVETKESAEVKRLKDALEKAGAENKALSEEVDAQKGKAKQTAARLTAQNERLTAQAAEIQRLQVNDEYLITVERMVRMFEELTGVTIQTVKDVRRPVPVDSDDEESNLDVDQEVAKEVPAIWFQCKQTGRNGALDYNLYTPTDAATSTTTAASTSGSAIYECEPVSRTARDGRTAGELPDFLPGPITFQRKMCSMFFWRACDFLNKVD
ncbi:hypothetical protein HDU87_005064 [Geranomyces variabilis]|uniref:Monopolin complex subunit Csm1/Pcs1 C-terminal domain-containing protein n=1 Tax=Geranomyces variabilis TaxID=109894 RepID=A0AAD5TSP6_9FUNG|nr:hypothetical protein HDU87_005064 [Geranomyces variabilis]